MQLLGAVEVCRNPACLGNKSALTFCLFQKCSNARAILMLVFLDLNVQFGMYGKLFSSYINGMSYV